MFFISTGWIAHLVIQTPKAKTEYNRRSFVISWCILWNNMSNEMRESTSLEIFKTKYLNEYFNWISLTFKIIRAALFWSFNSLSIFELLSVVLHKILWQTDRTLFNPVLCLCHAIFGIICQMIWEKVHLYIFKTKYLNEYFNWNILIIYCITLFLYWFYSFIIYCVNTVYNAGSHCHFIWHIIPKIAWRYNKSTSIIFCFNFWYKN
jgi:hypothetical protein